MLLRAVLAPVGDWRGFYLAPTYTAAKAIAWDYLRRFATALPGVRFNESELRVDLWNGARLQLLGAERYDTLRGRYADDLTLDETAQIPSMRHGARFCRPCWPIGGARDLHRDAQRAHEPVFTIFTRRRMNWRAGADPC